MTIMTIVSIGGHKVTRRHRKWGVAKAKARLSRLIEQALREGPQTITKSGREAVVIVSVEEWKRRTRRRGTLADFLAQSPLRGSGLRIRRSRDKARRIRL